MTNTFYDASTKKKFNRTVRKLFADGFQYKTRILTMI